MNEFDSLWNKLRDKAYREAFAATQVKRGVPFQIRAIMKNQGLSQEELAARSGLTQGAVSRAANPNYGNLTLNTLVRIAAGFDLAFVGYFVPFSELANWYTNLSEKRMHPATFAQEDAGREEDAIAIGPTEESGPQSPGFAHEADLTGTCGSAKEAARSLARPSAASQTGQKFYEEYPQLPKVPLQSYSSFTQQTAIRGVLL